jgi:hypothetical protein
MRSVVLDLGPEGAALEHEGKLAANEIHTLKVEWTQPFECDVRIRHSELMKLADARGPSVFRTGVSFLGLTTDARNIVDGILIEEATAQITEWEANLTGKRRKHLPSLDLEAARLTQPAAFVWHRFVDGHWTTSVTRDPNQPIDGFAVCDDEEARQVELLRKSYASYDENDRTMLRMMAHLAITSRTRRA